MLSFGKKKVSRPSLLKRTIRCIEGNLNALPDALKTISLQQVVKPPSLS